MKGRKTRCAATRCLLTAIVGLAFGHSAWGSGTVCVNTVAELALALDDAQGSATVIEVVQGTYDISTTVWQGSHTPVANFHDGSSLLGGYTANCTGRNIAVGNTLLTDAINQGEVVNVLGDATFEGLTFTLKGGLAVTTNSFASGSELLFRRNVFTGMSTNLGGYNPLFMDWNTNSPSSGTIRLVDNLVHDNTSSNSGGLGAVTVRVTHGSPKVELVNNTIVDNDGDLYGFNLITTPGAPLYLYNNILYGNANLDLFVQSGHDTTQVDNDIGTFFVPTPNTAAVGTLRGNPKLDSSFKPIESPASPVINVGTDDVIGGLPSTDLPGRDREIGSEPDLGAFESSVSDSLIQQVTTAADSGPGSLRAAIEGANANGSSGAIITFQIGSTCGPNVIHLATALPSTTAETHILGFTQPGSSANSLDDGDNSVICVILDGDTNKIADGFAVLNTASDAASLSVSGIAFSGFTHSALNLRGGVGHYINGIRTGGTVSGFSLVDVDYGIILGPGVHGATIGVANDDSSRNVLGGTLANAINIDQSSGATAAAHGNQIVNNYIGVRYTGSSPSANTVTSSGVSVGGYSNTIQNNVFGFNTAQGIHVTSTDAHDNNINNNLIGTDDGGSTIANGDGITIDSGAHDNDLTNNIIDNNTGNGVTILDTATHNNLSESKFASNRGLAIDLGGDGVSPNDDDSAAVNLPNRKQNFPQITTAIGEGTTGKVSGSISSTLGTYTIDVYASTSCDGSGYGEGTELIGSGTASITEGTISGEGAGGFNVNVVAPFFAGYTHITAIATDSSGDTSEFSQCFDYTDDQIFGNGFDPTGFF